MLHPFQYRDGVLHAEDVPLSAIAERHGTPTYVYSRAGIEARYRALDTVLAGVPHLICYAVKANSNLAVLDALARQGSGFDIVSLGELERVLAAGGQADRVVFSGVGKTRDEMRVALSHGVHCFNVESEQELDVLSQVAREAQRRAPISLRVNPDVDARTHPYISTGLSQNKFGVPMEAAERLYLDASARPELDVRGIDCHIGSQLTETAPLLDALERLLALVDRLATRGVALSHLDMGGGMGIRYRDEAPPAPEVFAAAVADRLAGRSLDLILEPGRALVGESGILLTRVIYEKHNGGRRFLVADAAMNDFIRPALYEGWHPVRPVVAAVAGTGSDPGAPVRPVVAGVAGTGSDPGAPVRPVVAGVAGGTAEGLTDVVGPVCESADFLAKGRSVAAGAGDLLALEGAGAYGFVMSSNYNTRARAAEVMVDGAAVHLAREREPLRSLFALEHRLPD